MQLPAISSLVSLLSSSITGLEKLWKPTSLVAATYFALLHLVLIFPPLRDSGFAPIVAFERLPTVWQVVLGTFILFTLAYILTVMGESFLSLVNGRALHDHDPGLASMFRGRQTARLLQLQKTIRDRANSEDWSAEDAADKLAYEFPDEERDVAPTTLGNILLSPASYTYRQYGARLDTIWPILARKIDEKLREQINGEMEAILFLATMSVLSVVAALQLALVFAWFGDSGWPYLWCLVLLLVAMMFYYATFPKARAWGLGIRTAFDQHLELAATELGLWELTDPQQKQQRWREVSAWLSIGILRMPPGGPRIITERKEEAKPLWTPQSAWYEASKAAVPLTVKHSPNVIVSDHSAVTAEWPNSLVSGQSWRSAGREIAYIIAVTNQGDQRFKGTQLQVVDTRLPVLPVRVFRAPRSYGGSVDGVSLPDAMGNSPTLLWFFPPIAAGETQVLRYRVRSDCSIHIITGPATIVEDIPNLICLQSDGAFTFAIDVLNENQLDLIYDWAGNRLNPIWSECTTEHQAIKRATFEATSEVQIQWDGRRFLGSVG